MTGAGTVRRLELTQVAVVVTALLVVAVVSIDAVRFHVLPLLDGGQLVLDAHTAVLAALVGLEVVVLWRAARSLARQLVAERRRRRLPILRRQAVGSHTVAIVGGGRPRAFCSGLLRPRLYVTESALLALSSLELRAVVEHEACHARRRDPLRLAIARVVADGFGFIAPLRRLAARQHAVADLVADRAAVAAVGTGQPLAAALLRLEEPTPERLDQLLGRPLATAPRPLVAGAFVVIAALTVLAFANAVAPNDPALPLVFLPGLVVPALLALRAAPER